jgi:hypothetical protein
MAGEEEIMAEEQVQEDLTAGQTLVLEVIQQIVQFRIMAQFD